MLLYVACYIIGLCVGLTVGLWLGMKVSSHRSKSTQQSKALRVVKRKALEKENKVSVSKLYIREAVVSVDSLPRNYKETFDAR